MYPTSQSLIVVIASGVTVRGYHGRESEAWMLRGGRLAGGYLHAYGPSTATWTEAQERMVFMGFT